MKRALCFLLAATMTAFLAACASAPAAELSQTTTDEPSETAQSPSGTTPEPIATDEPPQPTLEAEETITDAPVDSDNWREIYTDFLSTEYERLLDAFMAGIAGIGFIDLDLDGTAELLIFDAGASLAMGLQFFDIIDGKVSCVSANIAAVGELYGNGHLSNVYVNAHMFDDFRLMSSKDSGESFFCIESMNGATDFGYTELIKFSSNGSALGLESLLYKYEEFDPDTGEVLSASYKIAGNSTVEEGYDSAYNDFNSQNTDTGYEAQGVFIWEGSGYDDGFEGFMSMVDAATKNYVPLSS